MGIVISSEAPMPDVTSTVWITWMASWVIFLVSIPLVLGRVPRGPYGFRTPMTLSSDAIWYPANRVAGVAMIAAALFIAVRAPGIAAQFPGLKGDLLVSGLMVGSFVAATLASWLAALGIRAVVGGAGEPPPA